MPGVVFARAWTISPVAVGNQVQLAEHAPVAPRRINCEAFVPNTYYWLVGQLERCLPGFDGDLPWWAYREKPDMRWTCHRRPLEQREVRIELVRPGGRPWG